MSANNPDNNVVVKRRPVSARKVEANRLNAAKSTGPRTAAGKANSRKNALKHGLFLRAIGQTFHNEDREKFLDFCERLLNEMQPVGPSEESEVEYIATCWLRLARLWRYENAGIESGERLVAYAFETQLQQPYIEHPGRAKLMSLLQSAKSEVEANGRISAELLEKIFNQDVYIKFYWPEYEARAEIIAKKNLNEIAKKISETKNISRSQAKILLAHNSTVQPEFRHFVAKEIVENLINQFAHRWAQEGADTLDMKYRLQAIPDDETADKIIRYGNAIERHMDRAYARLERLQLRRQGHAVSPPMSIHLIR